MTLKDCKKIIFFLSLSLFFIFTPPIFANEAFKSAYEFNYSLQKNGQNIRSRVATTITLTNLKSDIYVKKLSLIFPATFAIKNINARDNLGPITPQVEKDQKAITIKMTFSKPNIGRGTKNKLYLQFDQDNLFKQVGNIWEVIIPTLQNRDQSPYKVVVNLPVWTNKKISIAKPKPSLIKERQIIWNNPRKRTIYAVFGDKQFYQTRLLYNLNNPQVIPVYTYIALPPETAYQKIYLNSLKPKPAEIKIDEDGNYLAKYFLNPKETKEIEYQGTIEIFSKPQPSMVAFNRQQIKKEKQYLLTAPQYWRIEPTEKIKKLTTPKKIYRFVTDFLSYNHSRLRSINKRLGAENILHHPHQAVCIEFSDLFIAIAREQGIPARELEGYGYATNSQLRPLSLSSDSLHSWPEYYDQKNQIWIPTDPTWENTSGIDYFSSLDLNHIVFAIHGKKADYPYPAGMYKKTNFRSVYVQATSYKPKENIKLTINHSKIPTQILTKKNYPIKIIILNQSNIFLRNLSLVVKTNHLAANLSQKKITLLAPLEKRTITLNLETKKNDHHRQGKLVLLVNNKRIIDSQTISIVPYYQQIALIISLVLAGGIIIFFLVKRYGRSRH